jgi:hypothetical protein
VRFHGASNLHCRQHDASKRVNDQVDWHILGRILDRCNNRLGIFKIDLSRDTEKAATT